MTREERLARESVLMARSSLVNTIAVLDSADDMLEKFDEDDARVMVAIIRAKKSLLSINEIIDERKW